MKVLACPNSKPNKSAGDLVGIGTDRRIASGSPYRRHPWGSSDLYNKVEDGYWRSQAQFFFGSSTDPNLIWNYLISSGRWMREVYVGFLTHTLASQLVEALSSLWPKTWARRLAAQASFPRNLPQGNGKNFISNETSRKGLQGYALSKRESGTGDSYSCTVSCSRPVFSVHWCSFQLYAMYGSRLTRESLHPASSSVPGLSIWPGTQSSPLLRIPPLNHGEIKPPKALTSSFSLGGTRVSGGFTGQDFLVFARGLNQPRARRGVVVLRLILDTTPSNAIYQSE
ncbi:unnamed protein product [Vicia faba]|uniref:Uncharacterized protein n=1 Tax=Vicia faba TaxID=3906 RepID=A0AAV0ZR46_VICFA|nr:unnamed protein product [Vicia faba]